MRLFRKPAEMRKWCAERRAAGAKIALVPTMGALHAGHLSLIETAKRNGADEIVVSVFVNPVQFGPKEDFAKYPRTEKADAAKCRKAGVSALFLPSAADMYGEGYSVYVNEERLSRGLCGARRPGHFRGVCTVVAKLFNIVQPHFAVFGQKDFQQAAVIRRMVRDLNFGLDVIVSPIVREESGLAMSSRNAYLSAEERERALALSRSLFAAAARAAAAGRAGLAWKGEKRRIASALRKGGLKVDYVEAVDATSLEPVGTLRRGCALLAAVYCGRTRLIDNVLV